MSHFLRDLRHALRSAARQPGTSLVMILTVAVGIGANTAIFTYFQELYWARSPVPEPERVFWVRTGTVDKPEGMVSYLDSERYREAIEDLGTSSIRGGFGAVVELPDGLTTHRIGIAVSAEFFDVLGTRITLGRGFLAEEARPEGPPVAVLSHDFWNRYLGADPSILGRTLRLNSIPFTIVGVVPRTFQDVGFVFPLYVPAQRIDDIVPREVLSNPDARRFSCLLRLHQGATREAAETRFEVVAKNLDREAPWPGGEARHITLQGLDENAARPETGELMLAGAVGLLMLLACANVANLLLARATGRQREIAVLAAIGASRRRIGAHLLTESLLLAVAGGALGLLLAQRFLAFMRSLLEVLPLGLPTWGEGSEWLRLDARVLLFTFALALVTGCLFGLTPILYTMRGDLVSALKNAALERQPGRRFGSRQVLVVVQVLLSTVLLLVSALLIRSLDHLQRRELGYDTDRHLLVALSSAPRRADTAAARRATQRRLLELARKRLAALPEVETATLTSQIPGGGSVRQTRLELAEHPEQSFEVDLLAVEGSFFSTFGIPRVRGRTFGAGDRAGTPGVAIVNRAFAESFWDSADPIGRELRLPALEAETADDRFVVVGQVADTRHASRRDQPAPLVLVPFSQTVSRSRAFVVARTFEPPRQSADRLRQALTRAHPDLAMLEVDTYDRLITFDLYDERLYSGVAVLFSLFGLGLACLGIYGVMSFSVVSRRRELGIRMALGATGRDLVRRILGEALSLVAAGVLLGVAVALVLARLLTSLLHGIAPHDPGAFLVLPPLLAAIGVAAAWLPAWRAGRTDPNVALREE